MVLLFTCSTSCVKPKPASDTLPTGPPMLATPVMFTAGPVPASSFGVRAWARVAYCTRNSLRKLLPSVETSCAAVECWRSVKSVARCTEVSPPPMFAVMKLSKNM